MKTVLQELIDGFYHDYESQTNHSQKIVIAICIARAQQLLEKEKQQIIEAVDKTRGYISGEQYFNETYGPKPLGIFNHDLNLNDTINQKDLRAAIDKVNEKLR